MLTKILLAGLIPGAMAKPIAMASSSSAKMPFSTAAAEKAQPKLAPGKAKAVDGTYPVAAVAPVPYAVVPLSSVVTSVIPSVTASVLPTSLAIDDVPVVPVIEASYPVAALPSSVPIVSAIQSSPVQEIYAVKTPSLPSVLPVSTPTVLPTTLVQLPYSIKTPAVQVPVASYPVVGLPSSIKTPAVLPAATYAAAELPYGVKSAAAVSAIPYGAASTVVSAVSSLSLPYRASAPPVPTPSLPTVSPSLPSVPSLPPGVPDLCVNKCLNLNCVGLDLVKLADCKSNCIMGCKVSNLIPAVPSVPGAPSVPSLPNPGVPVPQAKAAAKTPATKDNGAYVPSVGAGGLTWESCMSSCDSKFQYTGIGDTFQGSDKCLKACAGYSKSGVSIYGKRDTESIAERSSDKKIKDSIFSKPTVGAGAESYEACVQACSSEHQFTSIGKTGQGRDSCQQGCFEKFGYGAGIYGKRDSDDLVERSNNKLKESLFTKPAVGAGYESYEACVQAYDGEGQFTSIGKTGQGRESHEAGCAAKFGYGAGILGKRDVEERKNKEIYPSPPSVGVGSAEFYACVSACSSKYQGTSITNSYTGKSHCEKACSSGSKYGAGIFGKKDSVPLPYEV